MRASLPPTGDFACGSYKMKLSIILGVLHMLLGLMCSLVNALHSRSAIEVWCDFVPQAHHALPSEVHTWRFMAIHAG